MFDVFGVYLFCFGCVFCLVGLLTLLVVVFNNMVLAVLAFGVGLGCCFERCVVRGLIVLLYACFGFIRFIVGFNALGFNLFVIAVFADFVLLAWWLLCIACGFSG